MKKEIPNLLTLGNLLAGCIGLWFVMQGDLVSASYCIFISLICDFFDGFLARALQAYSELGKQLDSLADMVSFGVLPAFILFSLVEQSCGTQCTVGLFGFYKPFMVFTLVLMSAYRLAKFNIDTRQTDSFIGLPTPANSLFIAALPFVISANIFGLGSIFQSQWFLIIFPFVSAYLLMAEIPLFALKFKSFAWQNNQLRYLFLLCCLISLFAFGYLGINISIVLYILFSIYNNLQTTK